MAYIDKATMKDACNADAGDAPGMNADCKFIAPGEDISTSVANRPHLQLAENCDVLKVETDKLSVDIAVFLNESFTLAAPANTIVVDPTGGAAGDINFTGKVLIDDGTDSSYNTYNHWRVTDGNHSEVVVNDNIVQITNVNPSAVGQGFYDGGVVTFTLNETLPAGTYRLVFARDRQRGSVAISDDVRHQHRHENLWDEVKTREAALQAQITALESALQVTQRTTGLMRALNTVWHKDIIGGISGFEFNSFAYEPVHAQGDLSKWVAVGDDGTTARHAYEDNNPIPGSGGWNTGAFSPVCDEMQDVVYADGINLDGFLAVGRVSGAGAALFSGPGSSWTDRSANLAKTGVGNRATAVLYDPVHSWWIVCGEDTSGPTGWIRRSQNPTSVWSDPTTFPSGIESLMHMAIATDGRILAVGRKTGVPDEAVVLKSSDGGDTWTEVFSTDVDTEFSFVAYSPYHDRWAVGVGDEHWYTDDDTDTSWVQGGRHWTTNAAMAFDEFGTLIAIGGGGFYDISYDLGATWSGFWWREAGAGTPYFPTNAPNCMKLLGGVWLTGVQDSDDILISHFSGTFGEPY